MKIKTDDALTNASPAAQRLYQTLLDQLRKFGPFEEETKKTSVHLVRNSAFVGVRFRRGHLNVTIKSTERLDSARCVKSEQVSKHRWHNEVNLYNEADFDQELSECLRAAYELCA